MTDEQLMGLAVDTWDSLGFVIPNGESMDSPQTRLVVAIMRAAYAAGYEAAQIAIGINISDITEPT